MPFALQELWDQTFSKLDRTAPARRADESGVNYLRRLAVVGKKYLPVSEEVTKIRFADLPDEVVPRCAELVREAVERNIVRTDNMAPGELRTVTRVIDEISGVKAREFVGPDSFVKEMGTPARRVTRINAPAMNTIWSSGERGGVWQR
jgi:hypothetical protein